MRSNKKHVLWQIITNKPVVAYTVKDNKFIGYISIDTNDSNVPIALFAGSTEGQINILDSLIEHGIGSNEVDRYLKKCTFSEDTRKKVAKLYRERVKNGK